jgi:multidrug efflux pump subunit AcrB
MQTSKNFTANLISSVLASKLPFIILVLSMLAGMMALNYTPREEEPQIVVPMIDVVVTAPGVNVQQVERLVTTPLEKLLAQVKGVEHVYSVTNNSQTRVTLRFHVGENRENALLNTYNKLHSNTQIIPAIVSNWRVQPIEVDDVPIIMLGLWSSDSSAIDDFHLRRLAEEVSTFLQAIENTSEVNIVGGRSREIQVNLEPEKMTARSIAIADILSAIQASNALQSHGNIALENQSFRLESGDIFRDIETLKSTPINVIDGSVILLKDIATIIDGPAEQSSYSWIDFANGHQQQHYSNNSHSSKSNDHPIVTLSVAKQPGSNAVTVAQEVHNKIDELKQSIFPQNVHVEILRDYGETANEKVNNLTTSLAFAVFTVVIFIAVFLGWRAAVVVGLAVPICYGITLSLDLAFGYTINRVTLFALILSFGLLVDDPITGVDNIERYLKNKTGSLQDKIVAAINEIRVPLLMSTLTIVLAFIPLAFITGMMGPYMAPMAFNVPLSVISSTLVAFLVTPWLASKFIKEKTTEPLNESKEQNQGFNQFYRRMLTPLLEDRKKGKLVLWGVLVLFIVAAILPVMRLVPLKLLPFDNKNELQIIIDMPEKATLEQTAAIAKTVSNKVQQLPEIKAVASYIGTSSPIDFNGMVRQYYQRQAPYMADLRILLLDKTAREHQSHAIVLRLRKHLATLNTDGVNIKIIEVPPGPPVLSTLVAELYGDEFTQYSELQQAAIIVENRLKQEPHVVEVDSTVGSDQPLIRFVSDKIRSALSGISTVDINQTLAVANSGKIVGFLHVDDEATPLPINIKLPIEQRETLADFYRLTVKGQAGILQQTTPQGIDIAPRSLVALGELGQFEQQVSDKAIFHKDLKPVVYVTADISGRTPAAIIADVGSDLQHSSPKSNTSAKESEVNDWTKRTFFTSGGNQFWQLPENITLSWSGEGECMRD